MIVLGLLALSFHLANAQSALSMFVPMFLIGIFGVLSPILKSIAERLKEKQRAKQ